MKKAKKIFLEFLQKNGLKLTVAREIILDTVLKQNKHFEVEKIYDIIRKKHQTISRATIYRTINLLLQAGFIKKVLPCMETDCYETIFEQPHHLHFICSKCGKIVEMPSNEIEKIYYDLAKTIDFDITELNFTAKGICSECKKK